MIYLRNLTIDDLDYLNSVENNKSFWKYSFQNKIYSKEELIQFIYDSQLPLEQTNQIRFVICKTETDEPLGFIDLFEINFTKSQAGISILISPVGFSFERSISHHITKLASGKDFTAILPLPFNFF